MKDPKKHYLWAIFAGFLALLAVVYLGRGFSFLLSGPNLPVDLALRWWESKRLLVDGLNIYEQSKDAIYPPSTLVFFFPVLAAIPYASADAVWAVVHLGSLGVLFWFAYSTVRPFSLNLALFTGAAVLAAQANGQQLGVGQITTIIMALVVLTLKIREWMPNSLVGSFLASVTLAVAMGKVSISLPLCMVLFAIPGFRVITVMAAVINLVVSQIVAATIGENVISVALQILENTNTVRGLGSLDIHALGVAIGAPPEIGSVLSLLLLIGLGMVAWKFRRANLMFLLALASIVGRFWTYHNHYDNTMLLFLPISAALALSSIHKSDSDKTPGRVTVATLWLAMIVLSLVFPARVLVYDAPFFGCFLMIQLVVWLTSVYLLFLFDGKTRIIKKALF